MNFKLNKRSILQQDGGLYGDGWTPLMAAAVADRHNIAVRLLSAAGSAVGALVRHANRYGQTAVHIAARKGSLPLLTALLTIGGPSVAAVHLYCTASLHKSCACVCKVKLNGNPKRRC